MIISKRLRIYASAKKGAWEFQFGKHCLYISRFTRDDMGRPIKRYWRYWRDEN